MTRLASAIACDGGTKGTHGAVLKARSTVMFELGDMADDEVLHLVPGGRYLVTKNRERRRLRLWDLGLPRTSLSSPVLLAEMVPESLGQRLALSFDQDKLRVGYVLNQYTKATCVPLPLYAQLLSDSNFENASQGTGLRSGPLRARVDILSARWDLVHRTDWPCLYGRASRKSP